ncbi:MAG: Gldg family protein [Planctomycetes bacterium]|nr:Gldg family protein [Planctomycetota bacterium]
MVNRRRNFTLHFYLMSVLVMVALGAVNYLGMEYRARLDLTADKRFTLSEGTERLFDKLTEPITVTYYVDAEPPAKRINLERDVRDKLEELAVSSGGKLEYRVERIANEEAAERKSELEELGIRPTLDVLTTGDDERAEMRGMQGYYSSLVVSYGTSKPKAVNGIVNLVEGADEERQHRVDTLEFDIAYSVLTMRNETQRPSFGSLLARIDSPVQMALFVTGEMPSEYAQIKQTVDDAVGKLVNSNAGEFDFVRTDISARTQESVIQPNPFVPDGDQALIQMNWFANSRQAMIVRGQAVPLEIYTTHLLIRVKSPEGYRDTSLGNFTDAKTVNDVQTKIQDTIWELYRPRTRLGFVLPPHDPMRGQRQPGQPPANGHSPLLSYIQQVLEYETIWVDIKGQKRVPRDLACLIVLEPNLLSERELYEIDRFLVEGGNVVMLVQGWSAKVDLSMMPRDKIRLSKEPSEPHFDEWLKHVGVTVQQDLLLRPNAKLQGYAIAQDQRGQYLELVPGPARLAPVLEPKDLNSSSVFTRGLSAMPLPLVVETSVDAARISELGLEQTELIRLKDDIYKFLPANPAIPDMPISFDLKSPAEVERNPNGEPGEGILAQRLDHDPLVATLLTGEFPSLWVDEKRKIPGWEGDPEETDAPPVSSKGKGNLLVVGTAATLNIDYLRGYPQKEIEPVVIDRGLTFYRNLSEAFIFGEDLVSLRARTGVAPRIVGPVDDQTKMLWFLICIAGAPAILMGLAGMRTFARTREREEYETGLGIREEKGQEKVEEKK